jgi:hypothetical protein
LELDEKILNQIGMDELVMLDKDGNLMDSDVGKYIPIKNNNFKRKIFLVSATLLKAYRG